MQPISEADQFERSRRVLQLLFCAEACQFQRQGDILQRRQHRDQVERLEDESDVGVAPAC